jgi:dolichol kinase
LEDRKHKISLKNELLRKTIHIFSSVIPFFYLYSDFETTVIAVSILTVILILIDIFRLKLKKFNNFYLYVLNPILRKHEKINKKSIFTGGTYIVIGYLICILVFPKEIAIASMFIAAYSDTAAAIIGKVYGRIFVKSKTVEGSIAFFVVGVFVVLFTPKYTQNENEIYIGFLALLITTIYELIPVRLDDNIFVPLFFGLTYFALVQIL